MTLDDDNKYKNKDKSQEEDRQQNSLARLLANSTEIDGPQEQHPLPPHSHSATTTTQQVNFFGAVGEKQPPPACRLPAQVVHHQHHHQGRDDDAQTEKLEQAHRDARYAIMRFLRRRHAPTTSNSTAAVRSDAIGFLRKSRDSRLAREATIATSTAVTRTVDDEDHDQRRAPRADGDEEKNKRGVGVGAGVHNNTITPPPTTMTTTAPTEQVQKSVTPLSPTTRRKRIMEFTEAVTRAREEMTKREKNEKKEDAAQSSVFGVDSNRHDDVILGGFSPPYTKQSCCCEVLTK